MSPGSKLHVEVELGLVGDRLVEIEQLALLRGERGGTSAWRTTERK